MRTGTKIRFAVSLLALAVGTALAAEPLATDARSSVRAIDPQALARAQTKLSRAVQLSHRFDARAAQEGRNNEGWRSELIAHLMQIDENDFATIEGSATLIDAIGAATNAAGSAKTPRNTANTLGEATEDLTYIPINPCRILDTRAGSGNSFAAGATHTYNFSSGNPGSAACSPSPYQSYSGVQRPKAVAANVTVDATAYAGYGPGNYLAIYPQGGHAGTSFLNYGAGAVVANAGVITINETNGQFSIFASAATQVIVDVFGVFVPPSPTALDCQDLESAPTGVAPGSYSSVISPSCPAGYTHTGGACNADHQTLYAGTIDFSSTLDHTFCFYRNSDNAAAHYITAVATCCRVPGRN